MKLKNLILLVALQMVGGCEALKQAAPNSWNVTVPVGYTGQPAVQGVWFGIGGALPWGKQ